VIKVTTGFTPKGYVYKNKIIMESHLYHVNLTWDQARRGKVCSPELALASPENACMEVATPPEFPKGIPGIWSPEHLFTAAVVSCFMTTFLSIAENSKLNFKSFTCNSSGKLDMVNGKLQMTEVLLYPAVTLLNETDRERALKVLTKTEAACLISNSITSKVSMTPSVTVA
jgi:organic hydroperoxide reductase OsmC/OhrA